MMMYFINSTHNNDNYVGTLILWIVVLVIFSILIFFFEWPNILVIALFHIFSAIVVVFFLDIIMWNIKGKEVIYTQSNTLIIEKTGRIIKSKKKISISKIEKVSKWEPNNKVHKWYSEGNAFWDIDNQGTICIDYKGGRYYVGRNLNTEKSKMLFELLKSKLSC